MKILNDSLNRDLSIGKPVKLDLGCGKNKLNGFYAVDQLEMDGIDIIADLNKPLDLLPNNCSEYIYSRHCMEHIDEFLLTMKEIYRVTRPKGIVEIIVPHFSNVYGYSDPTHVRLFGLYSMYYFVSVENQPKIRKVPSFYSETRFIIKSIQIDFYQSGIIDRLLSRLIKKFVNLNIQTQDFYERRLAHLFHAWQIRYILTPDK